MELQPKGAKVIVRVDGEKHNEENLTKSGIYLAPKEKDSGDDALLFGEVTALGTPEIDDNGHVRKPDVLKGTPVWFNRYNSFKIVTKGLETYWVVPCKDIYLTGKL